MTACDDYLPSPEYNWPRGDPSNHPSVLRYSDCARCGERRSAHRDWIDAHRALPKA